MTGSLLSKGGVAALRRLASFQSVLVFDLDGTLAPIVDRPSDAVVPPSTAELLRQLSVQWPIGVVTGRSLGDAAHRLGFAPRFLYGNHGAEDMTAEPGAVAAKLDAARDMLREHAMQWTAFGIDVEDKRLSLALHYRRAADVEGARTLLSEWFVDGEHGVRVEHGHKVVNITPVGAADKGDALLQIVRESCASAALFVGDDSNDEPAFRKAPEGSVTARIGPPDVPTHAGFRLVSQVQVERLLETLLRLR